MARSSAFTNNFSLIEAIEERAKKMVVQEFLKSYFYYRMRKSGNVIDVYNSLEVPFYLAPPAMGRWIGIGDRLPEPTKHAAAMGYWTNRYFAIPTGYDMLEAMQKEGDPQQLINLADLRAAEQAWAHRRTFASALFNGTGGKQPDGLSRIIEKAVAGSQTAVVGGVNKATQPWFRNKYVQLSTSFGTVPAGSTLPAGFLAALQLKDQTTVGTLIPSDMITGQAEFRIWRRAMLEVNTVYSLITERKVADFGFQNFMFDGMHLGWDPNCPADTLYSLHIEDKFDPNVVGDPRDTAKLDADLEDIPTKGLFELNGSLALIMHPNIRSRKLPAQTPYGQMHQTEWLIDSINLGCNRLSDQGVGGSDNGSRWSTW